MAEPPRYFRTFKEISSRETFDPDCEITLENLASLVGEYHLVGDDEVPCQVRRQDRTTRCDEPHKNGWLGRRQDGKEALIGVICGTKYFNASSTFVTQRKRVTRELNIDRYIERLRNTRGSAEYAAELLRTLGRLKFVREATSDIRERLPASIAARLQNMAKSGNTGVSVLFRYEDEDDQSNATIDWVPDQIGTVAGIAVWDQPKFHGLFQSLHEIRDTLGKAEILREAGERKLKLWADKLEELNACTAGVSDLEAALDAFTAPGNLKLLCFLITNQNDAIEVLRVAIEQESGAPTSERAAQELFKELSAQIRSRAKGRSFRIDV